MKDQLSLGFFKRLLTSDAEEALVDGCRELVEGHDQQALHRLAQAMHLADGAFLAGFLALKLGYLEEAHGYLLTAYRQAEHLGQHFTKYGLDATLSLPVTDEVEALVAPDERGVLLGLVETCQRQKRWDDAIGFLHRLRQLHPDDLVVKVSLAELLFDAAEENQAALGTILQLAEGAPNESPVHAALLLYKGQALRRLGLLTPAKNCLTETLRLKKGRSDGLLRALRYERAVVYEQLGERKRAQTEFEKILAETPHYEDVAQRVARLADGGSPDVERAA